MPPLAFRILIRMSSWLVPWRARPRWYARWDGGLRSWCILVERGELIRHAALPMARTIRVAFVDAFWQRFNKAYLVFWVGEADFLLLAATLALVVTAAFTRGFPITQALAAMAAGHPARRLLATEGPTGTLIVYTVPILFACAASLTIAGLRHLSVHLHGWRYAGFFAAKTTALLLLVTLLWIEGGTLLRAHLHNSAIRILGGAMAATLAYIAIFAVALVWSFDDQRRRCPVCLRRLALPVAIGTWGSTFQPAITELLCENGHGALAMREGQPVQLDRWTVLDESWRDLFDPPHAGSPAG